MFFHREQQVSSYTNFQSTICQVTRLHNTYACTMPSTCPGYHVPSSWQFRTQGSRLLAVGHAQETTLLNNDSLFQLSFRWLFKISCNPKTNRTKVKVPLFCSSFHHFLRVYFAWYLPAPLAPLFPPEYLPPIAEDGEV